MESERAKRISHVFHETLAKPPDDRAAYLQAACEGDDALRREVESLLEYESADASILSASALVASHTLNSLVGRRLGAYVVGERFDGGGMGDIYRARDSKLGRDVAIKVLPPHFSADPERRSRFRREANVLATLSHPHIGTIYGFEETDDGIGAIVLELVEGPTLAQRLQRGPLPLDEALTVARQIADALDAAHEKGIVHRDLKPDNVVLQTPTSGEIRAKVIDFGLAKAVTPQGADERARQGSSPTEDGRILGTPAYMSPEQARGLPVDTRTDIWAFGCVLYEMLSGRRAFEGATASDTIVEVLERAPDWAALPARTPDRIRVVLDKCLRKDRDQRLHAVVDARVDIDDALTATGSRWDRRWRLGAMIGAALLSLLTLPFLRARLGPDPTSPTSAPTRVTFETGFQTDPTFSPDGTLIGYASNQSGNYDIWVKPVTDDKTLQVTNDPSHDWQPDWSPTSGEIVFRSERDAGGLFRVPPTGGPAKQLTNFGYLPQWSPDGTRILFLAGKGIRAGVYTVGLDGTPPRPIELARIAKTYDGGTQLNTAVCWHSDGTRVLFLTVQPARGIGLTTVNIEDGTTDESDVDDKVQASVLVLNLRLATENTERPKLALAPDRTALYFIAFSREIQSVWKVTIDPRTLELIAGPHRVTAMTDSTALALTRDGRRMAFDSADRRSRIATYQLDSAGRHTIGPPQFHSGEGESASKPDLTRDGTRLLFLSRLPGDSRHILSLRVKDLKDDDDRVLSTSDVDRGESQSDLRWSTDGTTIAFRNIARTASGGLSESIWVLDSGTGKRSQVTSPTNATDIPYGWSPDGRFVVASSRRYKPGHITIALVPLSARPMAEREAIVVTEHKDFGLWNSSMSPDGRWICFQATRTMSRSQIFVVRASGGRWTAVTDGTSWDDKPRWSPDGRLLYFVSNRGGLFNVWAIEFSSREGTPRGTPFPVTRFSGKEGIFGIYVAELGIGVGRLAIPVSNPTGGLWILDNLRH